MRWQSDLIHGKETENEWAEILKEQGCDVEISEGKFSEYDIKAKQSSQEITFEVKTDQMAFGTKNVAIEIKRENIKGEIESSGLSISTADYYVYKILHKPFFYYVSTDFLLKFIKEHNFKEIHGGDEGRTIMILVPLDDFISICEKIKRKTFDEYKSIQSWSMGSSKKGVSK